MRDNASAGTRRDNATATENLPHTPPKPRGNEAKDHEGQRHGHRNRLSSWATRPRTTRDNATATEIRHIPYRSPGTTGPGTTGGNEGQRGPPKSFTNVLYSLNNTARNP